MKMQIVHAWIYSRKSRRAPEDKTAPGPYRRELEGKLCVTLRSDCGRYSITATAAELEKVPA